MLVIYRFESILKYRYRKEIKMQPSHDIFFIKYIWEVSDYQIGPHLIQFDEYVQGVYREESQTRWLFVMAIRVVEFSSGGGTKLAKIFA